MQVAKPKYRSPLRQFAGREYYIFRRFLGWYFGTQKFAVVNEKISFEHSVFTHRSMILRPLKDVDMYLQENKRTNLRLAVEQLNNVLIRPGETLSIWKLVGRPTRSKGYLEGLVLNQGNISKGVGGGLCQLGNLLFWIFAHSELEIFHRFPKSHKHEFALSGYWKCVLQYVE